MSRFKVVLAEHGYSDIHYEREIIEAAGGELIDCDGQPVEQTLKAAEEADAVMVRRVAFTPERIRPLKRCRMLLRYGVGVDNIDLEAATEAGIIVGHVPVYCQDEVSTHAIALLLACARQVVSTHRKMCEGGWDVHRNEPVYRVAGKTLGLVGLGTLGQAVARKLQGWGLRLIAADPYLTHEEAAEAGMALVPLDELLAEADFVSVHVPLLPETTGMFNDETFGAMKPGAILVNTARGPVVQGAALLRALDSGRLAGAALDVFEEEPLPSDSPLRRHPKLIVTDHMAWYSEESQVQLQQTAAREVVRFCTGGLPEAIANPEVLQRLGRASEWKPNHLAKWQMRRQKALLRHFADVP